MFAAIVLPPFLVGLARGVMSALPGKAVSRSGLYSVGRFVKVFLTPHWIYSLFNVRKKM